MGLTQNWQGFAAYGGESHEVAKIVTTLGTDEDSFGTAAGSNQNSQIGWNGLSLRSEHRLYMVQ
jgi:hypothetical protein